MYLEPDWKKCSVGAARFVLRNYKRTSSVGAMLQQLSWPTLCERRRAARLAMMYKIQNNLVAIDITKYLVSKDHTNPTRTENSQAFHIPHSDRDYHKASLLHELLPGTGTLFQKHLSKHLHMAHLKKVCQPYSKFRESPRISSPPKCYSLQYTEVCTTLEEEEEGHWHWHC